MIERKMIVAACVLAGVGYGLTLGLLIGTLAAFLAPPVVETGQPWWVLTLLALMPAGVSTAALVKLWPMLGGAP